MACIKHIPCGVCGVDKPSPVGIPRVSKQAKVIISGWETLRVVQCTQCGLYYTDPIHTGMIRICKYYMAMSTLAMKVPGGTVFAPKLIPGDVWMLSHGR